MPSTSTFIDGCIFIAASSGTGSFVQSAVLAGYQTMQAAGAIDGQQFSYRAQSADNSQWEIGTGIWTASTQTLTRVVLFNSSGGTSAINFTTPPRVLITVLASDLVGLLIPAPGNLTFYVATTGSDSNPGTIGLPFLTIQHALNVACSFDYGGLYTPTINVAAGTYSIANTLCLPEIPGLPATSNNGGSLVGAGVGLTTILDANSNGAISAIGPLALWYVSDLTVDSSANCFTAAGGGFIIHTNGNLGLTSTLGSKCVFYNAFSGGHFALNSATITIGTPNFLNLFSGGGSSSIVQVSCIGAVIIFPSNVFTITSGTYVSATGVITLTVSQPWDPGIVPGTTVTLAGLTGTGAFAALNGATTYIALSSGTSSNSTFTLQGPIGAGAATISGGTATGKYGLYDSTFGSHGAWFNTQFNGPTIIRYFGNAHTNGANFSGRPLWVADSVGGIFVNTSDGTLGSFPGNAALSMVDNGVVVSGESTHLAVTTFLKPNAGPPTTGITNTTTGFPNYAVVKDTTNGPRSIAINDGGVIYTAQIGRNINTQTSTPYTLQLFDQEGRLEMNLAGANTVTVPLNATVAFPIGTEIRVTQVGAGATTISAAGGVTGRNFGALSGQWASVLLCKRGTDEWVQTSV